MTIWIDIIIILINNFVITNHPFKEVEIIKLTLTQQIFEDIYNKIKTGYYSVGDLLPTEYEMQEIYGVSRAPVREALKRLQNEGFIVRKAGVGSVVAENTVFSRWAPMGGFSYHFRNKTSHIECNTIDVSIAIVDKSITDRLKVAEETPLVQVTRVRKENNIPMFLLKHYYVDVDMEKIKEAGDILYMRQFASQVLGIEFQYVDEELMACNADLQLSHYLNTEVGKALLKSKRISYNSNYEPVEYVEYYVNTDNWPYKILFSKDSKHLEL